MNSVSGAELIKNLENTIIRNENRLKGLINILQFRTESTQEFLDNALNEAIKLTESKIGYIYFYHEDRKQFVLNTWSKEVMVGCSIVNPETCYELDKTGVWGEVVRQRKPMVINNFQENHPLKKGYPEGHTVLNRFMSVPVFKDDIIVAVVGVANKMDQYEDEDILQLSLLMDVVWKSVEIRTVEDMFIKSNEQYQTLFNEIMEGFALHENILDDHGNPVNYRFLAVNPAFERLTGLKADAIVGRTVLEVMPDTEFRWIETYGKVAISGEAAFFENYSVELNKHFEVKAYRSAPNQFACIFLDITERKRAEEERILMESQFQQTQKLESLGVLAGGIAHDFNNILSIILGHCYIADVDMEHGTEKCDHIKHIAKAAERAADLCHQLLSYAGSNSVGQTQLNLRLLVDENMKMLESTIKKNIAIELDLNNNVPEFLGDSAHIQQIVMNLIINAAEAIGDRNGTVKILLDNVTVTTDNPTKDFLGCKIPAGNYASMTVADDGCGMDIETQKRIFEPFFTTKFTGRGLGMSVVLGIIKSHNAYLQLNSSIGTGTTFIVLFPASFASESLEIKSADKFVSLPKGSGTVLFVDDEEGIRVIGSALLKAMGFSVINASSGREALEIFNMQDGISLVLLDMIMPEMSGMETYRVLRGLSTSIPVIICSGYSFEDIVAEIDRDENADVMQKPYNPAQLRNMIMNLINKPE
jgi:PAS domain S-box-containing protein